MVEYLTQQAVKWLCAGMLAMLPVAGAWAEGAPDPTRPPTALLTEPAGAAPGAKPASSGLQSVLISAGRKSAIIGGQLVHLGDKYGEARVTRITEGEVVLKTGSTTETLKLFPDVEKRAVRGDRRKRDGTKQH